MILNHKQILEEFLRNFTEVIHSDHLSVDHASNLELLRKEANFLESLHKTIWIRSHVVRPDPLNPSQKERKYQCILLPRGADPCEYSLKEINHLIENHEVDTLDLIPLCDMIPMVWDSLPKNPSPLHGWGMYEEGFFPIGRFQPKT